MASKPINVSSILTGRAILGKEFKLRPVGRHLKLPHWGVVSAWLERLSDKQKVMGSNPIFPTDASRKHYGYQKFNSFISRHLGNWAWCPARSR
jgi:hypothetical protein